MAHPFTSPAYDLIPARVAKDIPLLGATAEESNPTLYLKWFTPDSSLTWYVAEYDPVSQNAYGFVVGPFPEWGSFSVQKFVNFVVH